MERFNFEKLELPHRIFYLAKFLGMEMDRYNNITAKRPMDVNPESIALAAIAYLELRGMTKYILLQKLVEDTLKILPEYRTGLSESTPVQKAQLEEFQRKMLPGIAQMHLAKAQEMYEQRSQNWDMEIDEFINDVEWIARICTGEIKDKKFEITRYYDELQETFDIDLFTNRPDLYECMMRSRYANEDLYLEGREDALVLLGIPKSEAKKILDILVPHVFPFEFE